MLIRKVKLNIQSLMWKRAPAGCAALGQRCTPPALRGVICSMGSRHPPRQVTAKIKRDRYKVLGTWKVSNNSCKEEKRRGDRGRGTGFLSGVRRWGAGRLRLLLPLQLVPGCPLLCSKSSPGPHCRRSFSPSSLAPLDLWEPGRPNKDPAFYSAGWRP